MPGGRKTTPSLTTRNMMDELITKYAYDPVKLMNNISSMIENGMGVVDKQGAVLEIYNNIVSGKPIVKPAKPKIVQEIVNPLEILSIEDCKIEINRLRNEQRTANKTKYWDLKNSIDAIKEVLFDLKEIERREYWDAREEITRKRHEEFINAIESNTLQLQLYNAKELIEGLEDFDVMINNEFGKEEFTFKNPPKDLDYQIDQSEQNELDNMEKIVESPTIKDVCPYCNKKFKLLVNHKCKKKPKD